MEVNVNVICLTKTTRQLVYKADFATFRPALCFSREIFLYASAAETRFSDTAESNGMLCIPLRGI